MTENWQRVIFRRSWGLGVLCVWGAIGSVCGGAAETPAGTRVVRDMSGATFTVPEHPRRIADLWFAHNEVLAMLGGGDRLAVTVDTPVNQPWLFRLNPDFSHARYVAPGAVNPEGLIADGVDVVFGPHALAQSQSLRQAGLPTLDMGFATADELLRSITLTADVLNDRTAREKATRFAAEVRQELRDLEATLASRPVSARPRVLHLAGLFPLLVDGSDTIIDEWIRHAGGRNVATAISGSRRPVSMEQIAAWDPDVIIVQGGIPVPGAQNAPPGWEGLRAVRTAHVFANPLGMFPWDRYGSEFLLQLRWAAGRLHPDLFDDARLRAKMRDFYRVYFGREISDSDMDLMLAGKPPAD